MNSKYQSLNFKHECIVIGASAGGMDALTKLLSPLPEKFPVPIIIAQHLHPHGDNQFFVEYMNEKCNIKVKEADEKEPIMPGIVYITPVNYHLLVEEDKTFSLSTDEKVNFSRPSIDVLFESASDIYKEKLIGVILTGANSDGAKGLKRIKDMGGLAIVQDPKTAQADTMPFSAINACKVDYILPLIEVAELLIKKVMEEK